MNREKFLSNVAPRDDEGCALWTLHTVKGGYGRLKVDGHMVLVHRYAYEQFVGPIPEGYSIDHICHNESGCEESPCKHRRCVTPEHLEAVPLGVNLRRSSNTRASINAAKTHCPHGHEYRHKNARGWRYCLECSSESRRRRRARERDGGQA